MTLTDDEIAEIVDRLDEGEKKLARLAGAFPKWVRDEYQTTSSDIVDILEELK